MKWCVGCWRSTAVLAGRGGLVTVLVGRYIGWSMWVSPCGWLAVWVGRCGLVAMLVNRIVFSVVGRSLWVGRPVSVTVGRSL